jgi:hypothetical protein
MCLRNCHTLLLYQGLTSHFPPQPFWFPLDFTPTDAQYLTHPTDAKGGWQKTAEAMFW